MNSNNTVNIRVIFKVCYTAIFFLCFLKISVPVFASVNNLFAPPKLDLIRAEIEIPFEIHNNFIILNFRVNGAPNFRFIYDSGSENSLFFELLLAQALNFRMDRTLQIFGSDLSKPVNARVGIHIEFETIQNDILISDILVLEDNPFMLDQYFGFKIAGIIGNSMFRNKVVEIDYDKGIFSVYDVENFNKRKLKYEEIPSVWLRGKPYINPNILMPNLKDTTQIFVLFDTGASIGLLLYTNYLHKKDIPERIIPGIMGVGLGGTIQGFIGKVGGIYLESHSFNNVITHYQLLDSMDLLYDQSGKHGIMGNALIRHFNLALDFANKRLYLKRNSATSKPMQSDRSGMMIVAGGDLLTEYYVRDVIAESPAGESDIRKGDRIIKIGGLSSNLFSLTDVNRKLSNTKRKKINIVVLRDGHRFKKTLLLRDLI